MTTIVTRSGKGSPLTHVEVDTNFTNLNTNKLEAGAIALGSAATPSISFTGDLNTGIYSPGADQVAVATNGTGRLFVDATGNVGVGTTPSAAFHVLNTSGGEIRLASSASNYLTFWEGAGVSGNPNTTRLGVGLNNTTILYTNAIGTLRTAFAIGTSGAEPVVLSTANTERLRITSTGQVRLAGAGITFNGDTAAANELDDYEEGTFTPTIEGTTTAGAATYTRQAGVYTKVGRQVFYAIDVIYASGTGTGNLVIAGLPFTSSSTSMVKTGSIIAYNITLTASNYPVVALSLNATELLVQQSPVGGGAVTSVTYDDAGQIAMTGHYFV